MTVWEAIAVMAAGVCAGLINTVVGSGTLVTFPVLLAVGFPPVTANVSNSLGLVPGSLTGAYGYRRELAGQRTRVLRLGVASVLGAALGAVLLVTLPSAAFNAIVPVLVGLGVVLVIIQPWLSRRVAARGGEPGDRHRLLLWCGVFGTGVYGGYFGAAQGVLLLALMGILLDSDLQRVNAVKNVLAMLANLVAGLIFVFVADIAWQAVALVAVGSTLGGVLGAKVGRRLPAVALRTVIVIVGVAAIAKLLTA